MKFNSFASIIIIMIILLVFSVPSLSNETELSIDLSFDINPNNTSQTINPNSELEFEITNIIAEKNETEYQTNENLYCSFWNISTENNNNYACKGDQDCCSFFEVGNITPKGTYNSGNALSKKINVSSYTEDSVSVSVRLGYYENEFAGISEWSENILINIESENEIETPIIIINSPKENEQVTGNLNYAFTVNHTKDSECSVFLNDNAYALHSVNAPSYSIQGTIPKELLLEENSMKISCQDTEEVSAEKLVIFKTRIAEILIEELGNSLGSKVRFTLSNLKDRADVTILYPQVQGFPNSVTFSIGYNTTNPAVVYLFEDTYRAGTYTLHYNLSSEGNLIEQSSKTFTIENTLGCQILSDNNYNRGETATITIRASSGTEPYTLSFNNQNKTGRQNDFNIIIQGNDNMILEAKCYDFYNNAKSVTKEVKMYENITFIIKDSQNDSDITGTVSFYDTTITGKRVSISAPKGTYPYSVSASGYSVYNAELTVDGTRNVTVKMSKDNFSSLIISAPSNDSSLIMSANDENYVFRFLLSNEELLTCSLGVSNDKSWYTTLETLPANRSTQIAFNIPKESLESEISGSNFYAQVTCRKDSLMKKSDVFNLSIETKEDGEVEFQALTARDEESKEIVLADIVDKVAQSNTLIESYNPNVQAFLNAIGEKQRMNDAERQVRNARRDLHNIIYRQLSEEESRSEIQRLTGIIESIEAEIIMNVTLTHVSESVTYPSTTDISQIAERFNELPESHPHYTRIYDARRLSNNLEELQKAFSVTTTIMQGEVVYQTGSQVYTTIIKSYNIRNTTKDMIIIDDISSLSLRNLQANNLYDEALYFDEDRGIVFFRNPLNQGTYSYYSMDSPQLSSDETINSYLIDRKLITERPSGVTGFATAVGLPQINLKGIGALILLILIVVGVYGLYSGKISLSIPLESSSKPRANARMLRSSLNEIEHHSKMGDYEKAFLSYEEASVIYRQLSQKQIDIFHPEMTVSYASLFSKDTLRLSNNVLSAIKNFSVIDSEEYVKEAKKSKWMPSKKEYDIKGMVNSFKENVDVMKNSYNDMNKLSSYKKSIVSMKEQVTQIKNNAPNNHVRELAITSYDNIQEAISKIDSTLQSYKSSYDALRQQHSMIRGIAKEKRGKK